jgi:uncharacterized protein (TIGR00730 family)
MLREPAHRRLPGVEPIEQGREVVVAEEDPAVALGNEALPDGVVEERLERREVAVDVEQADRLGVEVELRPRQDLGQLLERAEAAGQRQERVGQGGHLGLMGAVADAALAAGGRVVGVIPRGLVDRELAHHGVSELRIVDTLHQRKAVMAELSDGFIALPGGLGTLEELAEVLSWAQLDLHAKPIGLLDVGGYFGSLEGFLDHAVSEGFVAERHRRLLLVDDDIDRLLAAFAAWRPPASRFEPPRQGPPPA